jgi:hypothetical protein
MCAVIALLLLLFDSRFAFDIKDTCLRDAMPAGDECVTVDRRSGRAVEVEMKVMIPPVFVLALR